MDAGCWRAHVIERACSWLKSFSAIWPAMKKKKIDLHEEDGTISPV
jgi:hypothetical protein